jgi:hypothetical protein
MNLFVLSERDCHYLEESHSTDLDDYDEVGEYSILKGVFATRKLAAKAAKELNLQSYVIHKVVLNESNKVKPA